MAELVLESVGDIIVARHTEFLLEGVKDHLKAADVLIGQLEVPYSSTDPHCVRLGRQPDALAMLKDAGFRLLTLAGNHIMDAGAEGLTETIAALHAYGMEHVGAGSSLREARRGVVLEEKGVRLGFLDYNCVGPPSTWAGPDTPGCAWIAVHVHYETVYASVGGPPIIHTWCDADSLARLREDIEAVRPRCDVLFVSLHKGIGHIPVKIADYEVEVAHAAVDAGADLVFAHHAHILKGIEVYNGRVIFHGLGNFAAYVPADLSFSSDKLPADWARRRQELFGFTPDPEYPTYPFHPQSRYTLIATCLIRDKRVAAVGWIPCMVNRRGGPEVPQNEQRWREVCEYVERISRAAGFAPAFERDGDWMMVSNAYR